MDPEPPEPSAGPGAQGAGAGGDSGTEAPGWAALSRRSLHGALSGAGPGVGAPLESADGVCVFRTGHRVLLPGPVLLGSCLVARLAWGARFKHNA